MAKHRITKESGVKYPKYKAEYLGSKHYINTYRNVQCAVKFIIKAALIVDKVVISTDDIDFINGC